MNKASFLLSMRSNKHYLSLEGIEDELNFRRGYLTKALKQQKMSERNYRLLRTLMAEISVSLVQH